MKFLKLKKVVCLVMAVICASCVCLTASAEETKEQLKVSYKNRKAVETAVLDFVEENKEETPSVSITVFDNKQDICNIVYGYANKSEDIKADENTVYEWGSVSKLLVWTSAMQLYEQGKLDLNKDIKEYLPKGFLKNLSFDKPVTMIDLMNHSAGFQETVSNIETEDINDIVSLDKALKDSAPAQVAPPGETVSYSNWGAALGGYVVSCVSGMDYADYVKENIFDKLGMEHTYIRPDASDNDWAREQREKVHSYAVYMDEDGITDMGECRLYINLYPAGSTGGTISDLTKFAKALLSDSKDCPLFEKDDTLDIMLSPSWTFGDGSPRICHGMFYSPYGDGLYGHGGNTKGFSSDLQLNIKNKTGYVMMINTQGDRIYTDGLSELLYGEKKFPVDSDFEKIDISGHYKMGRSCGGAGLLRILSPTEDAFNVYKDGENFTGSNGVSKLTQISDTFVKAELINNTEQYYAIKKDSNGKVLALESYYAIDFTKQSNFNFYTDWTMLILFVASILIMAVMFIIHIIRLRKFKDTTERKFRFFEMLSSLSAFLILVEVVVVGFNNYYFFYAGKLVYAIVSIILCALALLEFVMLLKCHFDKEKPQKKILLNFETACSIVTIVGIIYWTLFQWWGF